MGSLPPSLPPPRPLPRRSEIQRSIERSNRHERDDRPHRGSRRDQCRRRLVGERRLSRHAGRHRGATVRRRKRRANPLRRSRAWSRSRTHRAQLRARGRHRPEGLPRTGHHVRSALDRVRSSSFGFSVVSKCSSMGCRLPSRARSSGPCWQCWRSTPARCVPTDRLLDQIWGDAADGARRSLQVYVSNLRKLLADTAEIASVSDGYVLEIRPAQLDFRRFTELAREGRAALARGELKRARDCLGEALDLWRGPALADFTYETFARRHRTVRTGTARRLGGPYRDRSCCGSTRGGRT